MLVFFPNVWGNRKFNGEKNLVREISFFWSRESVWRISGSLTSLCLSKWKKSTQSTFCLWTKSIFKSEKLETWRKTPETICALNLNLCHGLFSFECLPKHERKVTFFAPFILLASILELGVDVKLWDKKGGFGKSTRKILKD